MKHDHEALRALSEKATPSEWHHCQPFKSVPAENTVHGRVPAQRVDYVSTWPRLGTPPGHRVIIPMEGRECHVSSDDMAFIAALVSAYRSGDLIHRSKISEETARAGEWMRERCLALIQAEIDAVSRVEADLIETGGENDSLSYAGQRASLQIMAKEIRALPLTEEAGR